MQSKKNDILLVISKLLSPDVTYISHVLAVFFSPYHLTSLCVRIREYIFRQFGAVQWFSGSQVKGFLCSFPPHPGWSKET